MVPWLGLNKKNSMNMTLGAAEVRLHVDASLVALGRVSGLLVPRNAMAVAIDALVAAHAGGARSMLLSVQGAALALPALTPNSYLAMPPELRALPVAVLATPEQWPVYEHLARAAARAGVIRRAFLCADEALDWVRREALLAAQTQAWLRAS